MRSILPILIAGLFSVVACRDIRTPSDTNFTKAINLYLAKHGEACTPVDGQFPIDIPESRQSDQYGIEPKLSALERAGLVHAFLTTGVVHGMLDGMQGSMPPQPVKRYELTGEGKKYFQQVPGVFRPAGNFCYGQKSVDTIIKWTEPIPSGAYAQTEVTYTYRIMNLAGWAEHPDVQHTFSDIQMTVNGQSKTAQVAGLQLTNKGWEVPEQ